MLLFSLLRVESTLVRMLFKLYCVSISIAQVCKFTLVSSLNCQCKSIFTCSFSLRIVVSNETEEQKAKHSKASALLMMIVSKVVDNVFVLCNKLRCYGWIGRMVWLVGCWLHLFYRDIWKIFLLSLGFTALKNKVSEPDQEEEDRGTC
jgi:hypothetical protein